MKILLLGAAGFIGTNLTIELAKKTEDEITLVDRSKAFFKPIVGIFNSSFNKNTNALIVMPPPKITVPVPDSIIPVSQPKGKDTGKKKKRRKARRKERRSSLRRWGICPGYESLASRVSISLTPSHNCSCRWDISSKSAS